MTKQALLKDAQTARMVFSIQLTARRMEVKKATRTTIGASQAASYKDVNPTLPSGAPNPYLNAYYHEYVNREFSFNEPTTYYRAAAAYELKVPFMTQRFIGATREDARSQGRPTPNPDAFLDSVPEGTPSAGFTKVRSNLVASYRFSNGPLRNFSVGGGAQDREKPTRGISTLIATGRPKKFGPPPTRSSTSCSVIGPGFGTARSILVSMLTTFSTKSTSGPPRFPLVGGAKNATTGSQSGSICSLQNSSNVGRLHAPADFLVRRALPFRHRVGQRGGDRVKPTGWGGAFFIPRATIADREMIGSLMPARLTDALTSDELRDLLAYLTQLGKVK